VAVFARAVPTLGGGIPDRCSNQPNEYGNHSAAVYSPSKRLRELIEVEVVHVALPALLGFRM
jgi:hypothetical protein